MTWTAFLLAALKALPAIVALISQIKASSDAAVQRGIGSDLAVKAGLEQAAAGLAMAEEEQRKADLDHQAHPNDDSGFDPDGQRKD